MTRARSVGWAVAMMAAACAGGMAPGEAAIDIPGNTWVRRPSPAQTALPDFPGTFQARGWSHMVYDPYGRRVILYDGYLHAARPYSIYANAIWTYDVVANRLRLEKVNNWVRSGGVTVPTSQNSSDPTPYDRHTYGGIAFVPDKNRLYLWSGANNSITTNYIGDTWVYDFGTKRWREIVTATHPFTSFEQMMTYDPAARRLVLFGASDRAYRDGDRAWLFHVDTETWEDASSPSTPSPRMSHTMVYDAARRVSWMFGGGSYPNPGNELWSHDAASRTWRRITTQGPTPPARRFACMAYDSQHDVILMWGGIQSDNTRFNDTWIFRPATLEWQRLTPPASPPASGWNADDLVYDPDNDVFVLHLGGEFWLYRYGSGTTVDTKAPAAIQDLRVR